MNESHSDALVFFGATGDLAYKKIFPSLQAMVKRGTLNVPVIGVAKSGWNIDQLRARARDSLEKHGGVDRAAFDKLCGLLRYVDGDYNDPATFRAIRKELGSAQRPAHYLAIPPVLFGLVVEQLGKSGCSEGRSRDHRKALRARPRFGAGAQSDSAGNLRREGHLPHRPLPGEAAGAQHGFLPLREFVPGAVLEPQLMSRVFRSPWLKISGCRAEAPFTIETGTIRDVVQNHLFQVLTNLAMEPPVRTDSESIRDEKVKVLKAIPPLDANNLVRGQFRGYRTRRAWRRIRRSRPLPRCGSKSIPGAGKAFPFISGPANAACDLHGNRDPLAPAADYLSHVRRPTPNYFRFRISPEVTVALGMMVMDPGREDDRRIGGTAGEPSPHAQARWMPTNGCWETPWPETPRCLPARTMWKRRGESSIRC